MRAPESIAWAIHDTSQGYFNCSYLRFYCEEAQREEAAKCFQEAFNSVRKEVFDSYRKEEEEYEEDELDEDDEELENV